ncbi:hypothetical protein H112_04606 [Trichophyton rubrum D6]|uniref:AMP-dependent synthetase/ligase domain-containing protein n=2 Tax=Trichophyton TaxID=5550 RepID=A0A022W226_TRIRU|nr:hypothetical protein H100_04613 [Trichophyton rubrum MR850]EZF41587.1 hypothetical protein H102_04600 [Trichophyton rubrum CBS 100081]EZF52181.1 hypothetical protein H103_04607 [Trichophyton rubrum CBS 288.86]EZF62859.1 hypothetical protein H104_04595 [Trichophyton rubrum CBS 289.86]EZF73568.1 hypothetical protein H105_04623 [Trichophyton soudanense CBS 452.61]EZF84152.1 hypothetical protein H110_04601 [Trichophyton rubrum MR1448]EZF94875.1 hypothetical protein H113_04641 [Trichophyton rub
MMKKFSISGIRQLVIGGVVPQFLQVGLVSPDGADITEYNKPGELWIQGPKIAMGYLKEEPITKKLKDSALVVVIDRVQEVIDVKGFQAEPKVLLIIHLVIADTAVIAAEDSDGLRRQKPSW